MDLFKQLFFHQTIKRVQILAKTLFLPKVSHIQCFSVILKHFRGNSQRTYLFSPKMTISEKSTEILRKFVFLNKFEKGQILRKIWVCLNFFFDQISKMREILTKTCFSPQSEPHTAKLYFSVVLKHFLGNSQRTSLFLVKGALNYSESLFFLTCLKRVNPEENLDLFKQLFLIKPAKGKKY